MRTKLLLIDGKREELHFNRVDHLRWEFYYLVRGGKPVAEISVPPAAFTAPTFKFRTGGHTFENLP